MGPPLATRHLSSLLVVHFIARLSLETKPRLKVGQLYRSSDVGLRRKQLGFFVDCSAKHKPDSVIDPL